MPPRPRIHYAQAAIEAFFDALDQQAFTRRELQSIVAAKRQDWRLPDSLTFAAFVVFMVERSHLREVRLEPTDPKYAHKVQVRFTWREASPLALGNALAGGSYLSHATAAFVHGLTDERPKTVYVNREQSAKPPAQGRVTQAALDRAFSPQSRQRRSSLIYTDGKTDFVMLAGKNTKNFGVVKDVREPYGGRVSVAGLERTLVDVAVRPAYAGGVDRVVDIYRQARDRAQISRVIQVLKSLDYVYPYHQCIGFYAARAGFPSASLSRLKGLGIDFDFYLTYGMKDPDHDPEWRLFFPKGT